MIGMTMSGREVLEKCRGIIHRIDSLHTDMSSVAFDADQRQFNELERERDALVDSLRCIDGA